MLTDHDITEELAAAFHDRADPVTRTAVDPAGIFPRGVRARRRQTAVRAAAVGAVAALAAVVLAVNLSPGPARPGPALAERPPGRLLAAAVVSPPPARAAVAGMPRYYVTVDHFRRVAEVRDSVTGKILSTVPLPRRIDPKMSQVAAAGDGRGFALALVAVPADPVLLAAGQRGRPVGPADGAERRSAAAGGVRGRHRGQPRREQARGGHPAQRRGRARRGGSGVTGHRRRPDLDHRAPRVPGRRVLGGRPAARVLLGKAPARRRNATRGCGSWTPRRRGTPCCRAAGSCRS